VRSSPSQPILLHKGVFAGDWLIGDVNSPGLVRVSLDRVGEEYNGAVFRFSQGTGMAAINRMAEDKQGGVVIGTITTVAGNWPSGENTPLYRLAAKAQATSFDIKAVRALDDGLELSFTQPVQPDSIRPAHFLVESARYVRQMEYGIGKQPDEARHVLEAEPSSDRRRVHLRLDTLRADRVYYVKVEGVTSSGGKTLWNSEAWFTLSYPSARKWQADAVGLGSAAGKPPGAADGPALTAHALADGSQGLLVSARCGAGAGGCGHEARFQARLYSPAGALLALRKGQGGEAVRFERPGRGPGVYLLRVFSVSAGASGNASVTQRVLF
jgi:hypothetical protein